MPLQLTFPSSRRISAEDIDYRLLRPLLIVPEIVSVDDYRDGVLIVKNDALILNGNFHDVPIAHSSAHSPIKGFYGIPFLYSPSPEDEDIFRQVLDHFAQTGLRRYFVRDPQENEPYLVDIDVGRGMGVHNSPYDEVRGADFFPGLRPRLEAIVDDFRQRESIYRSAN